MEARSGGSRNFVFKFANVDHDRHLDSHPGNEVHQYVGPSLGIARTASSASYDASFESLVTPDGHEAIALAGMFKAQLLASDFHFV